VYTYVCQRSTAKKQDIGPITKLGWWIVHDKSWSPILFEFGCHGRREFALFSVPVLWLMFLFAFWHKKTIKTSFCRKERVVTELFISDRTQGTLTDSEEDELGVRPPPCLAKLEGTQPSKTVQLLQVPPQSPVFCWLYLNPHQRCGLCPHILVRHHLFEIWIRHWQAIYRAVYFFES